MKQTIKIEIDNDTGIEFEETRPKINKIGLTNASRAIKFKTKFTRLQILKIVGYRKSKLIVSAICDCGSIKEYRFNGIKSGSSASCGCLQRDRTKEIVTIHGESRCPTRKTWLDMKQRCLNPKHKWYPTYGGRGIKICDEWLNYDNFKRDMGERPSDKHSIERVNVNGDYCPSNCIWELNAQQQRNKRTNVFITVRGKRMIQKDLADLLRVSTTTVRKYRLNGKLDALIALKMSDYEWLDEGGE